MSKTTQHEAASVETDPVWSLLDQSPPRVAGPRFPDDVVRLARLDADRPQRWWVRWFAPVPATAFAGLTAAVVIGFFAIRPVGDAPPVEPLITVGVEESAEARVAHLQEVLETEMLFAAVEHLDEFSDAELITLIGF